MVGSLELADEVFGAPVNEALLYEAVRHYLAGMRAGNARPRRGTKWRGSGKKLWKQKGTGRARMGSIRRPLWRHGGTVHGPQPRDYSYKLPRKMLLGALRSALSAKLRDGELRVVNAFALGRPQDQEHAQPRSASSRRPRPCCWSITSENRNLELGARNLQGVKLVASREVNVYDLLDA